MSDITVQIEERINTMPAVSANTIQILKLIAKADYNIKELADLIALDVSLTARCLKIVNSAEFSLRTEVTSIERAVSYLGKQAIFSLVIKSGFQNVFDTPLTGYNAEEGELWEHSLRTAIASRLIALRIRENNLAELAYTSGLLHNMGKVILTDFLKYHADDVMKKFEGQKSVDFNNLENNILETCHEKVGKMMAEKWGIPKSIQMAILFHHTPGKAQDEFKKLCYIVHLGDHFAMLTGGMSGIDSLLYKVDPDARNYLNLEDEEIEKIMFNMQLEYVEAKEKIFPQSK